MQSVKALAKAVSSEMADSLKSQEEVLTLALTKAQKDNNTVYLERVPAFAGVLLLGIFSLQRGFAVRLMQSHLLEVHICMLLPCHLIGIVDGIRAGLHACLYRSSRVTSRYTACVNSSDPIHIAQ